MPRAAIGELTVHYQQVGRGPDLILVHGLCCNLAFWYLTVVPKLAEIFRVTVYDLRGHGLTERLPRGYRAIDLADDLRRLLAHLRIDEAHLVGHSFGGAVALAFAIRHPEKVRSLLLADAWVPTLQPRVLARSRARSLRLEAQLRRMGIEVDYELPRVAQDFLEEVVRLRDRGSPDDHAGAALNIFFNAGRKSMALRRWWQLVRLTSAAAEFSDRTGITRDEISGMRRPTAVVFGRKSRYLPTMRGLQGTLSDCRGTIIPNAGHYFPILNPNIFTRLVSGFAAQHEG